MSCQVCWFYRRTVEKLQFFLLLPRLEAPGGGAYVVQSAFFN